MSDDLENIVDGIDIIIDAMGNPAKLPIGLLQKYFGRKKAQEIYQKLESLEERNTSYETRIQNLEKLIKESVLIPPTEPEIEQADFQENGFLTGRFVRLGQLCLIGTMLGFLASMAITNTMFKKFPEKYGYDLYYQEVLNTYCLNPQTPPYEKGK